MKRYFLLLLTSMLYLAANTVHAAYVIVPITSGLNTDVIANGVGSGLTTTTGDVDGVNYAFVEQGWQLTSTSTPLTFGLPSSGLIPSGVTSGLSFQLADYSSNNSLRLNSSTPETLVLQNQLTAQNVYLMGHSGSGTCVMSAKVIFTDNTNQLFSSIAVGDWFAGTPYVYGQFGRMNRSTNATENQTNGPRFYQYTLAISAANQSKQIESIEITRTSGTGVLNIYAVSYETTIPVATCPPPTALLANSITSSSASLDWTEAGTATQWEIKYGPSGFVPTTSGTAILTTTKPYTLTPLTPSTSYSYFVRSICGADDTSAWSVVKNFSTLCVPPALVSYTDSNRCGPGTVTLKAVVATGATAKWYENATGGVTLGTGSSFITPSISTTTTYYVAASSGTGCESTRQAVVATIKALPVVNLGNDTTICPGITYTLDAQSTGSNYLWSTSQTTSTISVGSAGEYSVIVAGSNGCVNKDTIELTAGIVPQNNLPPTVDLCEGDVIALNAGNTGCTFDWSTGATSQSITADQGGNYSVDIESTDGCVITDNSVITIRPLPIINLGADISICANATITLDAGNPGATYNWNSGDQTQTVVVMDSGLYAVTVTTIYDCVASAERHIAYSPIAQTKGFNFVPEFNENLGQVKFFPIDPTNTTTYEWDFGDGSAISNDQNPIHVYSTSGVFTVTLTVINECGNSSTTQSLNINLTTGIATLDNAANEISVYPNPAKDVLMVESTSGIAIQQISIFDILGKEVFFKNNKNTMKASLDVSGIANGVYFLHVLTEKGQIIRKIELMK